MSAVHFLRFLVGGAGIHPTAGQPYTPASLLLSTTRTFVFNLLAMHDHLGSYNEPQITTNIKNFQATATETVICRKRP